MDAGVTIKYTDGAYHVKLWYTGDSSVPGFQVTLGVRPTAEAALALLIWYAVQLGVENVIWHEWKKGGLKPD